MNIYFENDEWYQCGWCGWWGYFSAEEVPLKYCLWGPLPKCERCIDLAEPPWRPNNRDRCHEWLLKVSHKTRMAKLDTYTVRIIAEFIAKNIP